MAHGQDANTDTAVRIAVTAMAGWQGESGCLPVRGCAPIPRRSRLVSETCHALPRRGEFLKRKLMNVISFYATHLWNGLCSERRP